MRKLLFLIFITFLFSNAFGQTCADDSLAKNAKNTQNVIGLTPSKKQYTNGWAIGWLLMSADGIQPDSVRINGLYTNISPFQVFMAGMMVTMAPFSLFKSKPKEELIKDTTRISSIVPDNKLNGVSISLYEEAVDFKVNGLQITGTINCMGELNGLSISPLYNYYKVFKGIMASGLYNQAEKGSGLQIGLVNRTNEMTGMQIGLWNMIGNKGYPIINMKRAMSKP